MQSMEKLKRWNDEMKDTPRKLLVILEVFACAALLGVSLPLIWPFVAATAFALMMEPLVRRLRKSWSRIRLGRALATLCGMAVVFGVIGLVGYLLVSRVLTELVSLAKAAPDTVRSLYDSFTVLIDRWSGQIPESLASLLDSALSEGSKLLLSAATSLSTSVASGALTTATSLPRGLLAVVLTVMGTFYLSYDRERILGFFGHLLPVRLVEDASRLKQGVFRALFGQFKSQLIVSLLIMVTVIVGMLIQRVPYALVIGLIIGVADALPVVGAGLFLIPWSLIGFIMGDTATGVGMAVLYVATIMVRQITEPRIVGKNLGLYPLATMMSMFAGLQLLGFWGMLIGPVLLNVCKVVLDVDRERRALRAAEESATASDAPEESPAPGAPPASPEEPKKR